MKKNYLITFLVIVMALFMTACGSEDSKTSENKTSENKTTEKKTSENTVKENEKEKTENQIVLGNTVITPDMEVTIKKVEFSYDVKPDAPADFYSHYTPESGKVYVHVDTDIKNLGKAAVSSDELISMEVLYDTGFKYDGFPVAEDSGESDFTYANITSIDPLETKGMRYLTECPQEVETSGKPVVVSFTINGEKYEYKLK